MDKTFKRSQDIKLSEENIEGKIHNIGLGNNLMNKTPEARQQKQKNKYVGLHQTIKLLYNKENNQQNERNHMEWEKIFSKHI